MTTIQTDAVLQHLRTAVLRQDLAQRTDGKLLSCFLEEREEAAFAALVQRHGPMVWGVCRRILDHPDAEDAFQATFLVLFQKAAAIKPRERVGNWLYGVAYQTALHARRTAARRRAREIQVQLMPEPQAVQEDPWSQLQPLLDQELSRLPDNYRTVLVLCDLEGKTRKEAARQLKIPEGTVAGWLARARTLLARRLARQGLAMSGATLAMLLADRAASASVPASVLSSTIKAAGSLAAGQAATGAISLSVAALTEGVLKTMLVTKLKMATLFLLTLGLLGMGTTVLTYQTLASPQDRPGNPIVQADDKPAQTTPTSRKKSTTDKPRAGEPEEKNQDKPVEGRSADNDKVRTLLKQRLDLVRKNTDRLRQAHREGTVSEESVCHAELRLYKAEMDLCETRQARIAVLEKIVAVYREMEDRMAQQVKQGAVAPEVVNEATITRLEAEIALEREKAKSR